MYFFKPLCGKRCRKGLSSGKTGCLSRLERGRLLHSGKQKKRAGAFAAARLAVLKKQFDRGDENQCLNDVFKQLLRHFPQ